MILITIICGPTASGKSALAVDLAMKTNGVVINADSMQIYDALPILTAQPGADDRARVPHILYGTMNPADKSSAQGWRNDAIHAIEAALQAGQHPVVTGGTGLYIKALVEGLSDIPDVPDTVRQAAMALQRDIGNPAFHAALNARDPVMGAKLNPNDTQRLLRAWEVLEATGKSLSYWQTMPLQGPPPGWTFKIIIMTPEREKLHQRCDTRFQMMLEMGALAEVRKGLATLPDHAPVTQALGYRALARHIRGEIKLEEAITLSCAETRQYAKRQDTWFRHQIKPLPSIVEIDTLA